MHIHKRTANMYTHKLNSRAVVRDEVRIGPGAKAETAAAMASTIDARSIARIDVGSVCFSYGFSPFFQSKMFF